ncbi:MAG: AAA family ATPase [Alphaproteobacteria bacterium]|nr:AAA family ATPase [Alphaproteobacteria bacterium]
MLSTNKHAGRADAAQPTMIGLLRKDIAQEVKSIVKKTDATSDIRTISGTLKEELIGFQSEPCVVLLQMAATEGDEFDIVEEFLNRNPHLSVIIISDDVPFEQVRRLMRSGALDILPRPLVEEEFLVALEAAFVRVSNAKLSGGAAKTGKVITFMKACGGVGGTTLAIQAAHALAGNARRKKKVCLIDFDLQFGNVSMYLDVADGGELSDLLRQPDEIDATLFNSVVSNHRSGIDIIAAPQTVWSLDSIGAAQAGKIIEVAAQLYDYVIVDLPDYWTDWSKEILENAHAVVMVMQMTVAAVRHARRRLDLLQAEGLGTVPVFVVANRYKKPTVFAAETIKQDEVEKALGHPIDFALASNYKVVNEAQTQGIPIAEAEGGRKFAAELNKVAESISARL